MLRNGLPADDVIKMEAGSGAGDMVRLILIMFPPGHKFLFILPSVCAVRLRANEAKYVYTVRVCTYVHTARAVCMYIPFSDSLC